jgi:hypothetical protein
VIRLLSVGGASQVVFSVLLVNVIISKGNSTYLEGVMLLMVYIIISMAFILHVEEEDTCDLDELCGWEELACLEKHAAADGVVSESLHGRVKGSVPGSTISIHYRSS